MHPYKHDIRVCNCYVVLTVRCYLLLSGRLLSAGHDVSDGGLITAILEMAFAGNCGLDVDINTQEKGS